MLDGVGLIPVIGEPADAVNGVIYAAEGDKLNAALSLSAMIPIAGDAITGGKYAAKTTKSIEKLADATTNAEKARDAEQAAAAARREAYAVEHQPDVGYHHTAPGAAESILETGLRRGAYVTDRVYSPGDATMYLALPERNANPTAVLAVDLAAMRRDGIDLKPFTEVQPHYGQPGGGNEIFVDVAIKDKYLSVVERETK
ncbi:MAG: hypothetical protein QM679_11200 [Patulibacter sp.]